MAVLALERLFRFKNVTQAVEVSAFTTGNTVRKSWEKTHYKGIGT